MEMKKIGSNEKMIKSATREMGVKKKNMKEETR